MYRFALALVLIIFSFNAASASGLMVCCDMGKSARTITKVATPTMPKCHEMMEKADQKPSSPDTPQDAQKAKHFLCASLCASKMTNAADLPAFQAVAFEIPVNHGEHDRPASIDRKPESPPPKI